MYSVTVILADTIIIATCEEKDWLVKLCDTLTGKSVDIRWTDVQLVAVLAIGIGGDETPGLAQLYNVAEEACKGLPPECRPIP